MRRYLTGLCTLCVGLGMLLVMALPLLGWVFIVALICIGVGYVLFRQG